MPERPECPLTVLLSLIKSKNLYLALVASYQEDAQRHPYYSTGTCAM